MKWTMLALFAGLSAAPLARAAVADEFVCYVSYIDAHNNHVLTTHANLAAVREPVSQATGYDTSTAGSAELRAAAPQGTMEVSLDLNYRHDLRLSADHAPVYAVQTTCLTGTFTLDKGVTGTASSTGCAATAGDEVTIVDGAPAFDGTTLTAASATDANGHVELACRHLRSILH